MKDATHFDNGRGAVLILMLLHLLTNFALDIIEHLLAVLDDNDRKSKI
jgi:hypothetical protein